MKKILVPVDFSPNATNALNYAAEFNKKLHGAIHLFHSCYVPVPATEVPILPLDGDMAKEATSRLTQMKMEYEQLYAGMHFEIKVSDGVAEYEIVNEEKTSGFDLVMMGTQGASGMKELLIGSITAGVISASVCPVIVVPENAGWKGLKKIIFAENFGRDDLKNVLQLIELARLFDSEIILAHIVNTVFEQTAESIPMEHFAHDVVKESQYTKVSYIVSEEKDVFQGLNNYIERSGADLLAINMRSRSILQRIFSRSLTKKMVYHSHVPVIAFHTEM